MRQPLAIITSTAAALVQCIARSQRGWMVSARAVMLGLLGADRDCRRAGGAGSAWGHRGSAMPDSRRQGAGSYSTLTEIGSELLQRARHVGLEVVDVLDADRHAHEVRDRKSTRLNSSH